MQKIVMFDNWSLCDQQGNPIGHGIKVGNEYYDYISKNANVIQYGNTEFIKFFKNTNKVPLKYSISKKNNRIRNIIYSILSIKEVCNANVGDTIWFYIPTIYIFIYILFFRKKNKYVVTIFDYYSNNKVKQFVLQKALKQIDTIFVTNNNLKKKIKNSILIPDYAFSEKEYKDYINKKKENRVVCLGTMNEKKMLREAVETFNENGYPLYIVGQFLSEETYKYLCSIKKENIIIENKYLKKTEYYSILAESKFCLIPYDPDFYKNRTSGVMQECMFMDTIPISHTEILKFANIVGIGYKNIRDLSMFKFDMTNKDIETYKIQFQQLKENVYNYDKIRLDINKAILNNID